MTLPQALPGILESDGERVRCGLCGAWYIHLGIHLRKRHDMTPERYRELGELNRNAPLVSEAYQQRQRIAQTAHLNRIRPAVTPVMTASREQISAWSSKPRRTQMRREHAVTIGEHLRDHPRPSAEKPPPKQPRDWLGPSQDRLAELRQDPDWLAQVRARVTEARR